MNNVSRFALDLLKEIAGGETSFSTVSADSAKAMGLDDSENKTQEQADAIKDGLEELERAGLIVIQFKSGAGFYTVNRITNSGQDVLSRISK